MLLLCSGVTTLLSFTLVMLFRTVQYRTYLGGKYYERFILRSIGRELWLMACALFGVCMLGLAPTIIFGATDPMTTLLAWVCVALGCCMVVRMVLVGVLGHESLKAQLLRFGVRYPRESTFTGPVRTTFVHPHKLRVDNLDVDDSLPD